MKIEQEASADCADRLSPTVAAVCDRRASPLCENLRNLRTISHMNTKLNHIQNWPELAREARPVSGELRLRNGAAVKRINGGCQVVVDRATERSEAGRNSPESGTLGGAQSFGVTESATVSPKVCAPGDESTNQNTPKKKFTKKA